MMSNRRALYRPAFSFEQRRPLICNMLCSSITRRFDSPCTRSFSLSLPRTHNSCVYLVCVDRKRKKITLKYVPCPQNFGSFCCISSYRKSPVFFLLFFPPQTSQMDILIGTFGTVSILCWNGRQVSGWRRPGTGLIGV